MNEKLNEHLHMVDNECYGKMELLVEQMKSRAGITEKLKAAEQMKWIGIMTNVRNAGRKLCLRN